MLLTGILFVCCFGIVFSQQDFGLCSQVYQMHLYCTNQGHGSDQIRQSRMNSHRTMGKAGPRGPPGTVDYGIINATIKQLFQEHSIEMKTKLSSLESLLNAQDDEISQLKTALIRNRNRNIDFDTWYKARNNYYYKVFSDKVNYTTAESNCSTYGAKLASEGIRNDVVYSELISLIKTTANDHTWIGLDDIQTENTFMWSDDVVAQVDSTPWNDGQPNNLDGNQDCVEIRAEYEYKLNDLTCSERMGFLCEIAP